MKEKTYKRISKTLLYIGVGLYYLITASIVLMLSFIIGVLVILILSI